MFLCDTHADTLYRMQMQGVTDDQLDVQAVHFEGDDIRVQVMALFVGGQSMKGKDEGVIERELRAFETLKQRGARQIRHLSDARAGHMNLMLSIEGGEVFGNDPDMVDHYHQMGVCMAALIWNNDNDLATPACKNAVDGLTDLGREVVTRMHACHMAVDVSHLNEAGTLEIIKTGVPPLASHSSVHALCAHTRNLKDTQLRLLFEVGGYVGINFYPPFLTSHGVADLDLVIDHIAYVCDLGGENYVGLGSDFDGIDQKPIGLQNASHLPALFDRMSQRGFDAPLIEKIAGQNIAQYFERLM